MTTNEENIFCENNEFKERLMKCNRLYKSGKSL